MPGEVEIPEEALEFCNKEREVRLIQAAAPSLRAQWEAEKIADRNRWTDCITDLEAELSQALAAGLSDAHRKRLIRIAGSINEKIGHPDGTEDAAFLRKLATPKEEQ